MNKVLEDGIYDCKIDNRDIVIEKKDGHVCIKVIDKKLENDNTLGEKEKEAVVRLDIRDGTFHIDLRGRFITGNPRLRA
ncbi:MAG: hypothetical protein R6W91_00210 [Thermoplasmata archaeon]